jgi:NNP family nitrate/nitrite transporter-like MFS transporter
MVSKGFLSSGHAPTLASAFLYFDLSFMAWVLLGPLGVAIAQSFGLSPAQKGLMVAAPVLSGAVLRLAAGVAVDHIGPKRTGVIAQLVVIVGLVAAWILGIHSYGQVLTLGVLLGVAGASFAIALPLASRWYPPEHQGLALGIAGAGNSGTALAALFAPSLAQAFGWRNVVGLAATPLAIALVIFIVFAREAPNRPAPKRLAAYLDVLGVRDAWWLMGLYAVTFGGFVGLSSSLTIYFNVEYGLPAVTAGFFTAACVFAGSLARPIGGALADRVGGVRTLTALYGVAALGLAVVSFHQAGAGAALALMMVTMVALGAGNGAVFQLAPQRFGKEIGVVTGLVGMTGGVGGFYLAASLGWAKQVTGSYQSGLLAFAALALCGLIGLASVKGRWRQTWPVLAGATGGLRL